MTPAKKGQDHFITQTPVDTPGSHNIDNSNREDISTTREWIVGNVVEGMKPLGPQRLEEDLSARLVLRILT